MTDDNTDFIEQLNALSDRMQREVKVMDQAIQRCAEWQGKIKNVHQWIESIKFDQAQLVEHILEIAPQALPPQVEYDPLPEDEETFPALLHQVRGQAREYAETLLNNGYLRKFQ